MGADLDSDAIPHSAIITQHSFLSSPQVPDRLQRLVGRLDRLAVQLEGALGLNERDQFLHWVHIAGLEESLEELPSAPFARRVLDRVARRPGGGVDAPALELEALGVDEIP